MAIRAALIVFLIAGCCACAPIYKPILAKDKYKEDIKRVRIISIVEQTEILGQHLPSGANLVGSLFGTDPTILAGAAIGAVRNLAIAKETEERITPYKLALQEYDVRQKIHLELYRAVQSDKFTVTEFIKDPLGNKNDLIGDVNDQKAIVVRTRYSIDPTTSFIHVIADAELYIYSKQIDPIFDGSTTTR